MIKSQTIAFSYRSYQNILIDLGEPFLILGSYTAHYITCLTNGAPIHGIKR